MDECERYAIVLLLLSHVHLISSRRLYVDQLDQSRRTKEKLVGEIPESARQEKSQKRVTQKGKKGERGNMKRGKTSPSIRPAQRRKGI